MFRLLGNSDGKVVDEGHAGLDVGEVLVAEGPVAVIGGIGRGLVDGTDGSFCSGTLGGFVHGGADDVLDQAMDDERLFLTVAFDEGEAQEGGDGFVEECGVGGAERSFWTACHSPASSCILLLMKSASGCRAVMEFFVFLACFLFCLGLWLLSVT
jgi:hypothetical protein